MPTTITGPVRLPDGTIPAHGRIIFRRRAPGIASPLLVPGPVEAMIDARGNFSISLQGEAAGTPYSVLVEYWSLCNTLVSVSLPDIVVDGTAAGTLGAYFSVPIPLTTQGYAIDQGETLSIAGQYLDANNRPVDISDVSIASWLTQKGVRQALTVTKIAAAPGTFEISASALTTASLLGNFEWVIRLAVGARVVIEKTILTVHEVA